MGAKEKAKELVNKYADKASEFNECTEWDYDKQCALICVDEMIQSECNYFPNEIDYWQEVIEEINKL